GAPLDERTLVARAHDGSHAAQELALQGLDRVFGDLAHAVESAEVVDVDQDHDVVAVQRVTDVSGPALGGGLVAVRSVEEIFEELSPHTAFDLRQLSLFGD